MSDSAHPKRHFSIDCRGTTLDCRPGRASGLHVMGILNVTPDSFSDGGEFLQVEAAVNRAGAMLEEGASIIDIGGESSRPAGSVYGEGAAKVALQEELDRVVPVVEALRKQHPTAILSIDTYKPEVARACLDAGAHLINDITGLRYGTELAEVCAKFGAPLILMHSLGRPGDMPHEHSYEEVVREVKASLAESIQKAEEAGVQDIIIDPGFGFGKTARENLQLIAACDELLDLGRPVMVGISRKSTIGATLGTADDPAPLGERLYGSLGATAVAALKGASIVRTHDVQPTVEMLHVLAETLSAPDANAPWVSPSN